MVRNEGTSPCILGVWAYLEADVHPLDEVGDGEVLLGQGLQGTRRHAVTQRLSHTRHG